MGWISAPTPASTLIDEEFSGVEVLDKAWSSGYGERHCWAHLRFPDGEELLAVVLVKTWNERGERHNAVKTVTETMGPGIPNVPDRIWDNRPELPEPPADGDDPYGWAREWRDSVTAFRERFPGKVTELTADDVGTVVRLDEYGERAFTFTGWKRYRKSTVPTFDHCRVTRWREARYTTEEAA